MKEEGYAIAKLPFTLPPEINLKSNRNIALKRLDNILKKYCKNEEMKQGIMKAWDKMISKEHLMFMKDLSLEHQKMLDAAIVSYWIPWNVNFKDSISTPIRTTFDASSATRTGLSLNDCLAKGTPDLVELLAIVLDWMMGSNAFCGDISQFYPSILLDPEHWQYQRILLRENLDPDSEVLKTKLDMDVKGWAVGGEKPPPDISKDGVSVGFGGLVWYPEIDVYTLNIPPLCLAKKQRGRLPEESFGFDPKKINLEEYVQPDMTRRQITRAIAKAWDLCGKLTPVTLRIRHDLRKLIHETPEWDVAVSPLSRSLWI